ncbi:uncharacterized protein PGTG_15992 [Puccinia graminis f. sp. tritici CRL 75-36-700-3]|uniref:DNA endonuclease activator Ctp1 C-terminal domain-containing protein n=1 Tax=Puccinia graminis f. sp. tritici (strain CRL 75-36-700-3 / race SCCL) TaxID=418459 RepID=E3L0L6_PUCGT|nr:uncharacterized protein PGTG_15992 [Puccinia graminis f. sp. tritici CRL 75-36-700-3]EFP90144.2 hypothetical protein PGTG_15992 [Puccinia graminis f. sp. tritici CRL 75-36-700-3]
MDKNPTDDLQERLGFKDLQAAQDWLANNPRGRLVGVLDASQVVEHCQSHACLAERRSLKAQVASLSEKIQSSSPTNPSNDRTDTVPSIVPNIPSPNTSSDSLLRSTNHELKTKCDNLVESLRTEREQFEKERQAWTAFKRDYATIVACKIIEEQHKQASASHHTPPVPTANKDPLPAKGESATTSVARKSSDFAGQKTELEPKDVPCRMFNTKRPSELEGDTRSSKSPIRVRSALKVIKSPSPRKSPSSKPSPRKDVPSHRVTPRLPDHLKRKPQLTTPQSARQSRASGSARSGLPTPQWIRYSDRKARHHKQIWNDDPSKEQPDNPVTDTPFTSKKRDARQLVTEQNAFLAPKKLAETQSKNENPGEKNGDPSTTKEDRPPRKDSSMKNEPMMKKDSSMKKDLPAKKKDCASVAPVAAEPYEELSTTEEEPECESREIVKPKKKKEEEEDDRKEADREGSRGMSKGKGRRESAQIRSSPPSSESMADEDSRLSGPEDFPGQRYMRLVHKKRQRALAKRVGRRSSSSSHSNSRSSVLPQQEPAARQNLNLLDTFQIDPNNNFRPAKDLNDRSDHPVDPATSVSRHQHEISRHRHFNPPPLTPPGYWQMGFPDTQRVQEINQLAEANKIAKFQNIELQARYNQSFFFFQSLCFIVSP